MDIEESATTSFLRERCMENVETPFTDGRHAATDGLTLQDNPYSDYRNGIWLDGYLYQLTLNAGKKNAGS